jgi:hypothetical protein
MDKISKRNNQLNLYLPEILHEEFIKECNKNDKYPSQMFQEILANRYNVNLSDIPKTYKKRGRKKKYE